MEQNSEDLFGSLPTAPEATESGSDIQFSESTEVQPDTEENQAEVEEAEENEEANEDEPAKETARKEPKLVQLPLGRIKNIMKLDPDLHLASADAIALITKATEMFIETLAKECVVQKDPKKKTIQKRDVDQVLATVDSLNFLEGAMSF